MDNLDQDVYDEDSADFMRTTKTKQMFNEELNDRQEDLEDDIIQMKIDREN